MIWNMVVVMPKKFFNFVQDLSHGKRKSQKRRGSREREIINQQTLRNATLPACICALCFFPYAASYNFINVYLKYKRTKKSQSIKKQNKPSYHVNTWHCICSFSFRWIITDLWRIVCWPLWQQVTKSYWHLIILSFELF